MASGNAKTGRVRTVLVFGRGDSAEAVLATVVARTRKTGRRRLRTGGAARFGRAVVRHIKDTVLPVVDQITSLLGLDPRRVGFELSLVNCDAASTADVGMEVSGFSIDAAVLLALLSACLKLPVAQDAIFTGHLSSTDGDIGQVSSLPAKLSAAVLGPAVTRFVYPAPWTEHSLETLAPTEAERIGQAIRAAKSHLKVIPVTDVAQLLQAAVDETAVVTTSLRAGFFEPAESAAADDSPIGRAALYLLADNERRFWEALETMFLAGDIDNAKELLLRYARYYQRRGRYPGGFGRRLLSFLGSVRPVVLRIWNTSPLLAPEDYLALERLASTDDYEDTWCLRVANDGQFESAATPRSHSTDTARAAAPVPDIVSAVLREIAAETVARRIGIPIDAARAAYRIPQILVDSPEAFDGIVVAFHLFLLRRIGMNPGKPNEHHAAEALDLLARTFASEGGVSAARAEGRTAIRGGMRFVVDGLSDRFKHECQTKHVNRICEVAIHSRPWDERVSFMSALYDQLKPGLPAELQFLPVRQLVHALPEILQAYVRSLDHVAQVLKRF